LAQSGHALVHRLYPLSGVKRTWAIAPHMSAFDPKQTLRSESMHLDADIILLKLYNLIGDVG